VDDSQGTRNKIYDYIRMHPGTYLREIGRELGLAMGDLQYHLYALEDLHKISTVRRGLHKFIYPSDIFGDQQKAVLSILSQETPRELLLYLIENPDSNQSKLAEFTGLSSPTITWHINRLVKLGIIECSRNGRFMVCHVVGNVEEICRFVQNYRTTVWEKWASRLTDIVIALSYNYEEDSDK
jgi:predicted transcriptional regulator